MILDQGGCALPFWVSGMLKVAAGAWNLASVVKTGAYTTNLVVGEERPLS